MTAGGAPTRGGRLQHLDALRGIAACAVMIYHYTTRYEEHFGAVEGLLFRFPYGGLGVELFFIISGFVIFLTLERTGSVAEFGYKRFTRLYPAYWFCVPLTFAAVRLWGLPGFEVSLPAAVLNLSMLNRFVGVPYVDGVYWSLVVELVFYVWMAGLYRQGLLRRLHAVVLGMLALSLVPTLLEAVFGGARIPDLLKVLLLTRYWTFFATGVLMFKVLQRGRWHPADAPLIALCVFSLGFTHSWLYALLGTGIVACFVWVAVRPPAFLSARWLVYLGTISYPVYLLHQNLGYLAIRAAGLLRHLLRGAAGPHAPERAPAPAPRRGRSAPRVAGGGPPPSGAMRAVGLRAPRRRPPPSARRASRPRARARRPPRRSARGAGGGGDRAARPRRRAAGGPACGRPRPPPGRRGGGRCASSPPRRPRAPRAPPRGRSPPRRRGRCVPGCGSRGARAGALRGPPPPPRAPAASGAWLVPPGPEVVLR
jgi:peptidoglycan/LPS O-acetylase OafA/YrhL